MPRVFLAASALMLAQAAMTSAAWAQAQGMETPTEPPSPGGDHYVPPGQSDFERAEALIKSGSYDDAIPLLLGIVRDNPNEADSLYYLGFANEKTLNYKTAFEFYARAVKADPDHKRAHEGLGLLYLRAGDLPGATTQLDELKRICAVLCDERQRLAAKIGAYKDFVATSGSKPGVKGKPKAASTKSDPEDLTTMP
jgi:tetratricopeptide (TPR) repeat protein